MWFYDQSKIRTIYKNLITKLNSVDKSSINHELNGAELV